MSITELSLLFGGALCIGLWWWVMQAHDRVDLISREVCKDLNVQRLDEAVALRRVSETERLQAVGGTFIES